MWQFWAWIGHDGLSLKKSASDALLCSLLLSEQSSNSSAGHAGLLTAWFQPGFFDLGSHLAHDPRCWPLHSIPWANAFLLHSFCRYVSVQPAIHLFLCKTCYESSTGTLAFSPVLYQVGSHSFYTHNFGVIPGLPLPLTLSCWLNFS